MEPFAWVLLACAASALLALTLSLGRKRVAARRMAQLSLWLTLVAVPVAIVAEGVAWWLREDVGAVSKATLVGRLIAQGMNHGALALPCAFIAGLALRRASTR